MRVLKLLLILPVIFMTLPAHATDAKTGASAGDEARPENAEPQKVQSPSDRVERPKREAVKMSPTIRVSPLHPDESQKNTPDGARARRLAVAEYAGAQRHVVAAGWRNTRRFADSESSAP